MHALVERSLHEEEGVAAEEGGDGGWIAALEGAAFSCEDLTVEFRVGGEDGALAEDVGGEDSAMAADSLVDEGLWVLCFVGGHQLERFSDEGKAQKARRKSLAFVLACHGDQRGKYDDDDGEEEEEEEEKKQYRTRSSGRRRILLIMSEEQEEESKRRRECHGSSLCSCERDGSSGFTLSVYVCVYIYISL